MSTRLFADDVLFLQRLLSCSGFYTDTLDGDYGKHTRDAEDAFEARADQIAAAEGAFDARSERNIRTLRTSAQPLARRLLKHFKANGLDARILSGTRTYAEQTQLYRQGRFGNPGKVITNAKAGQSWHNFGLAWDIGLFQNGQYLTQDGPYKAAGATVNIPGLEWGGNWISFKDNPHYQLATGGGSVAAARARFEAGGR